jgi:hypothetical protein
VAAEATVLIEELRLLTKTQLLKLAVE